MRIKDKLFFTYFVLRGKTPFMKADIKLPYLWYGSAYGGFYILPDLLTSKSIVYSFGIGEDISFDLEVIRKHGCTVYGFDPTPKSIKWVADQNMPDQFVFKPYGIGKETGSVTFYLPENDDHVSGSLTKNKNISSSKRINVPVKSFDDIISESGHERIDVLKMDIEGAEYELLPLILSQQIDIKQILIEVHHRFYDDGNNRTKEALKLLREYGYKLFAFSRTGEELSFVK